MLGGECEGVGGDRELLAVQYLSSLVSIWYVHVELGVIV